MVRPGDPATDMLHVVEDLAAEMHSYAAQARAAATLAQAEAAKMMEVADEATAKAAEIAAREGESDAGSDDQPGT